LLKRYLDKQQAAQSADSQGNIVVAGTSELANSTRYGALAAYEHRCLGHQL